MEINLFYSWQNDLKKKYNRNFIEDCLKRALKKVNNNFEFENKSNRRKNSKTIILDQATRNTLGSNEITTTIFSKISEALIFVADVSIIGEIKNKYYPNSNVLTELGYSSGKIGWESIILIFNLSSGKPENLPFDIRGRRLLTYNYCDKHSLNQRNSERENLTNALTIILLQQIRNINPIENHPIVKIYIYTWNKIAILTSRWERLINSMYEIVGMRKEKDLTYDELSKEFNLVCSKIDPYSKPKILPSYFGNFNNWFDLLTSMRSDVTAKTNQIFIFHNKLHPSIIDNLSQAESITSDRFFFTYQNNLKDTSDSIINTCTYLKEANKAFKLNYPEQEEEYHRQYLDKKNDTNFGQW